MPAWTLPTTRVPDPMDAPPLRWAVLAPGGIAQGFVRTLHAGTTQRVVSVGSRSVERARAFADAHGAAAAYGSYAEAVADPDVDVVYVASPHSEHAAQALLAVEAGKPVLVEKPFTRNLAEAERVAAAAAAHGVFVMEAMWTRFLPGTDVLRQVLEQGLLGEVVSVTADHGQQMHPDRNPRLFDPDLAGGALLDLGVYPLSFASFVFGAAGLAEPSVLATGRLTDRGVDAQLAMVLTAGRAQALLGTTLDARTPTTATVTGTIARLEMEGPFYRPTTFRVTAADGTVLAEFVPPSDQGKLGMRYEAAEVARCVAGGHQESTLMPLAESLRVMGLMDEIRRQVGVVYPGEPAPSS